MKRSILALVVALVLVGLNTGVPRAQEDQTPAATPPPDPLQYTDPAMSFRAPANATLVLYHPRAPQELSDSLQAVAGWGINIGQREGAQIIKLEMETFDQGTNEWEGRFESQSHDKGDVMIRNKTPMTLSNGMPAYFLELTTGDGLETIKEFACVWSDGTRGVAISVTARLGDVSANDVKQLCSTASATRYPINQP